MGFFKKTFCISSTAFIATVISLNSIVINTLIINGHKKEKY